MDIFEKYDLIDVDVSVSIPKRPSKGITVVVGSSGSGKTTILKSWGMAEDNFDQDKPIIDLFNSHKEGEGWLISAGLRSIPAWRRNLASVSNGERHRAEVALKLSQKNVFIDEFTSVVDRNTARALCNSINKTKTSSIVIATCHRDVLEWLDFDNAYDCDSNQWIDRRSLRRDRIIKLSVRACDTEKVWEIFRRHHYLSGKINKSANAWVALYKGKPAAMVSIIAFPSGNWKNGWREHRTVVLPEFQGMGIGSALSDLIAKHVVSSGGRFFSKTAHPSFGRHRERSENWKPTSKNLKLRNDYKSGNRKMHAHRLCFSHEYIIK